MFPKTRHFRRSSSSFSVRKWHRFAPCSRGILPRRIIARTASSPHLQRAATRSQPSVCFIIVFIPPLYRIPYNCNVKKAGQYQFTNPRCSRTLRHPAPPCMFRTLLPFAARWWRITPESFFYRFPLVPTGFLASCHGWRSYASPVDTRASHHPPVTIHRTASGTLQRPASQPTTGPVRYP